MKTPEHRLNLLGMLLRPVSFQRSVRLGLSRVIRPAQLHEWLVDIAIRVRPLGHGAGHRGHKGQFEREAGPQMRCFATPATPVGKCPADWPRDFGIALRDFGISGACPAGSRQR